MTAGAGPGTRFPYLEFLANLNQGRGMTSAYLVRYRENGRKAVLKILDHASGSVAREAIVEELNGARLLQRLADREAPGLNPEHRLPKVYEFDERDEYFYVLIEYLEGQDLARRLGEGPLETGEAIRIAKDILTQLAFIHSPERNGEGRPICHGDVKPANIILQPQSARLVDFGIAKLLAVGRTDATANFGSENYSSPEKIRFKRITPGDDLFSAGLVLREMLTGEQPRQFDGEFQLAPLGRTVPAGLAAILDKAVCPQEARRYGTAEEFLEDLARFERGETPEAEAATRPIGRVDPPTEALGAQTIRLEPSPARRAVSFAWERLRGMSVRQSARGLLLLAVLAVAGWEYFAYRQAAGAMATTDYVPVETKAIAEELAVYRKWRQRSLFPGWLSPATFTQQGRKARLVDAARQIIQSSRTESTVWERDWLKGDQALELAQAIGPADRELEGMRNLCQGQVDRIRGQFRRDNSLIDRAILKLEAAAEAASGPEAYLGLARIYSKGDHADSARLELVLEQASERGFTPGRREDMQRAEAAREEAYHAYRNALQVMDADSEQACTLLGQAAMSADRSQQFYEESLSKKEFSAQEMKDYKLMLDLRRQIAARVDENCFGGELLPTGNERVPDRSGGSARRKRKEDGFVEAALSLAISIWRSIANSDERAANEAPPQLQESR